MTIENSNPSAQGQSPGSDTPSGTTPAQTPDQVVANPFDGIQKRIDQLVAANHDKDRQLQEAMAMNQQILLSMSQRQNEAPVQVAPPVDIDPEQKKILDAYFAPHMQAIKQQQAQIAAQSADGRMTQLVAGQDPRVAQRAHQIWADVKARGQHLNGFDPNQAVILAKGELMDQLIATARQGQVVQQGQNFNNQTQVVAGQTVNAPVNTQNQNSQQPDLDDDPEGASEWARKRLAGKTF